MASPGRSWRKLREKREARERRDNLGRDDANRWSVSSAVGKFPFAQRSAGELLAGGMRRYGVSDKLGTRWGSLVGGHERRKFEDLKGNWSVRTS